MPLGPNLPAFLTSVWGKAVSVGNATTLLNDTFGTGLCKTAVTHALAAASGRLQKTAGEINAPLRIAIHQDGQDAHQVQRKATARVGMHLG